MAPDQAIKEELKIAMKEAAKKIEQLAASSGGQETPVPQEAKPGEFPSVQGEESIMPSEEAEVLAGNYLLDSVIEMIQEEVPEQSWDTLPSDFGEQLDHYLYGANRQ